MPNKIAIVLSLLFIHSSPILFYVHLLRFFLLILLSFYLVFYLFYVVHFMFLFSYHLIFLVDVIKIKLG